MIYSPKDQPFTGAYSRPWTPDDTERHTHKATTWSLKELWAKVANDAWKTGDEGRAIREASAVIARQGGSQHLENCVVIGRVNLQFAANSYKKEVTPEGVVI